MELAKLRDYSNKSSIEEIRTRFDNDVERFSKLETGQQATVDAAIVLDQISKSAAAVTPHARNVLDIGCGAGNYTLKLLEELPNLNCTLNDLSEPMLKRAVARVSANTSGTVRSIQSDIREVEFKDGEFDIILAAAVLHHLRDESDWESAFKLFYRILKPGGSIWISDLVTHEHPEIHKIQAQRYADYLLELGGEDYVKKVFAYIEKEDSPRPLSFQLKLLSAVGFSTVEVLHKNSCFAAFCAIKN